MPATKTHPACTIQEGGMELPLRLDYKMVTFAEISPKTVNPIDIGGSAEEEEEGSVLGLLSCMTQRVQPS